MLAPLAMLSALRRHARAERTAHADTEQPVAPRRRADAQRNNDALLDAAAAVFAQSGVEAPVRDIAVKAGVGTVYRHSRPGPTSSCQQPA
jgi:hypothetical protein